MRLVFDLDGTLIETREANLAAYRSIGIEPPGDFHIRPWQEWVSPENHEKKQDVLPRFMLEHSKLLPAHAILAAMAGECNCQVLTNASDRTLEIVRVLFPVFRRYTIRNNMSPDMKLEFLKSRAASGIYFDDNEELVERVRKETRWQAVSVSQF